MSECIYDIIDRNVVYKARLYKIVDKKINFFGMNRV